MNPDPHSPAVLRAAIADLRAQAALKESILERAYTQCKHDWNTVPAHVYHKGYTIEGDAPGTMGVDWRGPYHVPARTEKRWKRTCRTCGKEEFTSVANVQTSVTETPRFT